MRLDKFLKVARLIKRRATAKVFCTQGRVLINGRTGKPGTEVKPGDRLLLDHNLYQLEIDVLATPETVKASSAGEIYRVLRQVKKENGDQFLA